MRIIEKCHCGASVDADDQQGKPVRRYPDGSGVGYVTDFVERWRKEHEASHKAVPEPTP